MTGPLEPVFRHRAGDVRVMVLNGDRDRLAARKRVAGRKVIRMQIVRDHGRRDAQEPEHAVDRLDVALIRRVVVEIADMRSEVGVVANADAERVLQQRATREHWRVEGASNARSGAARIRASDAARRGGRR